MDQYWILHNLKKLNSSKYCKWFLFLIQYIKTFHICMWSIKNVVSKCSQIFLKYSKMFQMIIPIKLVGPIKVLCGGRPTHPPQPHSELLIAHRRNFYICYLFVMRLDPTFHKQTKTYCHAFPPWIKSWRCSRQKCLSGLNWIVKCKFPKELSNVNLQSNNINL